MGLPTTLIGLSSLRLIDISFNKFVDEPIALKLMDKHIPTFQHVKSNNNPFSKKGPSASIKHQQELVAAKFYFQRAQYKEAEAAFTSLIAKFRFSPKDIESVMFADAFMTPLVAEAYYARGVSRYRLVRKYICIAL